MPDPTEITLSRITDILIKDSENKLATQIVLIAIELSESKGSSSIHKNIIEAVNFVANAKMQMGKLLK